MKAQILKLTIFSSLAVLLTAVIATQVAGKEKEAMAASATASSLKDGGRLIIKRSPSLGNRLVVALKIDGQSSSIGYGHSYRAYLTPGHHTITVMATPKPQNTEPSEMTLDVEVGKTYTFQAQSGPKQQLVLAKY